jgi:hypothetical protein
MNVQEAVAQQVAKIEQRELEAAAKRAALIAQEEAACEEFRQAMRERIELEYGLAFTGGEVFPWEVKATGNNCGRLFSFRMAFDNGYVEARYDYRLADVTPPGQKLEWRAAGYGVVIDFGDDLIAALTYVITGKQ